MNKRGFIYQIILKDDKTVDCWSNDMELVIEMMFKHDIYIVQENAYPEKVAYIKPENVSYFRFSVLQGGEPI